MTYETPDQSPLGAADYDTYQIKHSYQMDAPGSHFRPYGMVYFSDWYLSLFLGNLTDFESMISGMSKE